MELIELRRVLRRYGLRSAVVAMAIFVIGLATLPTSESRYSATSTVLIVPDIDSFQVAGGGVFRVLLPNAVATLRSDSFHDAVAEEVPASLRDAEVVLDAVGNEDSGVVSVIARSPSPAAALAWSRTAADVAVDRLDQFGYLDVDMLHRASASQSDGTRAWMLGVVGSVGLAGIAFVLTAFASARFEESRDVGAALRARGVPVLATVASDRRHRRDLPETYRALVTAIADSAPGSRILVSSLDGIPDVSGIVEGLAGAAPTFDSSQRDRQLAGRSAYPALAPLVVREAPPVVQSALLRTAIGRNGTCLLVVHEWYHSVDEVAEGVESLDDAGIPFVGLVLIGRERGPKRVRRRERDSAAR